MPYRIIQWNASTWCWIKIVIIHQKRIMCMAMVMAIKKLMKTTRVHAKVHSKWFTFSQPMFVFPRVCVCIYNKILLCCLFQMKSQKWLNFGLFQMMRPASSRFLMLWNNVKVFIQIQSVRWFIDNKFGENEEIHILIYCVLFIIQNIPKKRTMMTFEWPMNWMKMKLILKISISMVNNKSRAITTKINDVLQKYSHFYSFVDDRFADAEWTSIIWLYYHIDGTFQSTYRIAEQKK